MKQAMEATIFSSNEAIDLVSSVKELHQFSPQQLNKILRDSDVFMIRYGSGEGDYKQIDMEKLARLLPLHLLAVLMSSDRDAVQFKYLLCGFRLLCSLCNLAPRQPKLEQILLDDVKIADQLLDLVIYTLIVLSSYRQDFCISSEMQVLHSALLTCCLHVLSECISAQWPDLAHVLLAHPKVDIFMEAAFGAVSINVRSLKLKLSDQHSDLSDISVANMRYLFLQCEACLNFLHSLCQQKSFQERVVRNNELSRKGGILLLARSILKLHFPPFYVGSSSILATLSGLKSKILSIILHLCESESVSYLDEVAGSPESMELAKSVGLEVLKLMKAAAARDFNSVDSCSNEGYPTGILQVNALRLVDVFSNDSNFRYFITVNFTEFIASIFLLPHGEFLHNWCSSELPLKEEDVVQDFDPFMAAGWILNPLAPSSIPATTYLEFPSVNSTSSVSYMHQRTSLLVKVIANLHCFVSDVCEEQERNFFLYEFNSCIKLGKPGPSPDFVFIYDGGRASNVCRNLRSFLGYAESLIPNLVEDDVHLLRVFVNQVELVLCPVQFHDRQCQAARSARGNSAPSLRKIDSGFYNNNLMQDGVSENFPIEVANQALDSKVLSETDCWGGGCDRTSIRCMVEVEKDNQNSGSTGSDSTFTKGNHIVGLRGRDEVSKREEHAREHSSRGTPEGIILSAVTCVEKKKRKRKKMNDLQICAVEKAILDEPEMHRNATLLQLWADKLSSLGSEVTLSQLKNWINNRKAKLARAAKEAHAQEDAENATHDLGRIPVCDSLSSSPGDDFYLAANSTANHENAIEEGASRALLSQQTHFSVKEFVDKEFI